VVERSLWKDEHVDVADMAASSLHELDDSLWIERFLRLILVETPAILIHVR
jgi:hypothetical protein